MADMTSIERGEVVGRIDDLRRDMKEHLESQDRVLAEIRIQAKATNGRVTELERKRIADEAAQKERERIAREQEAEHDRHIGRRQLSISRLGLWVSILVGVFLATGTILAIVQAVS